jgi:molybdopterin synthase sulfur carrier subunit
LKLKVLYFASIREKVGRDAEEIEIPAGVSTVAGLRGHLQARGGAWAEALADGRLLRTAVNQDMAAATATIKAGDEVAFFPPVTGG